MELDYNQIFDGVTLALHEAFPTKQIFGGIILQGLNPGDINVKPINTEETAQIGTRAARTITFDVIFYPPDENRAEACLEMQHELARVLELITTPNGDQLHCLRFSCSEQDALHFIVSYPHFVYEATAGDVMEHLQPGTVR